MHACYTWSASGQGAAALPLLYQVQQRIRCAAPGFPSSIRATALHVMPHRSKQCWRAGPGGLPCLPLSNAVPQQSSLLYSAAPAPPRAAAMPVAGTPALPARPCISPPRRRQACAAPAATLIFCAWLTGCRLSCPTPLARAGPCRSWRRPAAASGGPPVLRVPGRIRLVCAEATLLCASAVKAAPGACMMAVSCI